LIHQAVRCLQERAGLTQQFSCSFAHPLRRLPHFPQVSCQPGKGRVVWPGSGGQFLLPYHSPSLPPRYTSARHSPVATAGTGEKDPGLSTLNTKQVYSPTSNIAHTPASIQ